MNLTIWIRLWSVPYGAAVGACLLLEAAILAVVNPILPLILSDNIGLDKNEITLYFLMYILLSMAFTLGTGYISDGTVARYKLAAFGGLIASGGYLGMALAHQPQAIFIAGAATVPLAVIFPQLFAVAKLGLVADWEHEDQMQGITALRTLFSLGYILGTAVASWVASAMDPQEAFFFLAPALFVFTGVVVWVIFQLEERIIQRESQGMNPSGAIITPLPKSPLPIYAMMIPLLSLLILRGADSTRGIYLPLVMDNMFDNPSVAANMFGITATAELLTMGMIGYMAARTGEKVAIAFGSLVGAVYFVMMSFSQSLTILYLTHILYAVFVAALLGVAMAYIQKMLAHRVGLGSSIYIVVMYGGALMGLFTPLLVEGYDQKIFIAPAVMCVIGASLLLLGDQTSEMKEPRRKTAVQKALLDDAMILKSK